MKKKSVYISGFLIAVCLIISAATRKNKQHPVEKWREHFSRDISILSESLAEAHALSENDFKGEDLQKQFAKTRKDFKRIEFIVAYLDPEFCKDYINGAPLLHMERKAPSLVVLEPKGMQVLDEWIFSDETVENKEMISAELKGLLGRVEEMKTQLLSIYISDRQLFEAMRFGIIRIVSLGITGFDTPSSPNAIGETVVALEGIHRVYQLYHNQLMKKDKALALSIKNTFSESINYAKRSADFDQFDRMIFIKDYANPLYGKLLDAQLALSIETIYEVGAGKQAVNYMSRNIFSSDFLDPDFFVNSIDEKENELKELGRMLFFDPILSGDGKRSCASCHAPEKGFSDGLQTSFAFGAKGHIDRNSPGLLNAIFAEHFFYDMRASRLDEQITHVVVNHKEFNTSFPELIERLKQNDSYREKFEHIFPERKELIKDSFSKALITYVKSISGFESDFDYYIRGESDQLSTSAQRGFNLFMGKATCGTCHFAPLFSGLVPPLYVESESEVLGVPTTADSNIIDTDLGRYANKKPKEHASFFKNSFKTMSVRNVELTAPYMHNGVYATLEEVIDFYNEGGGAGKGMDVPHQTLASDALELTDAEKTDLIAFMKSLTDRRDFGGIPLELPGNANASRVVGGSY